MNGDLLPILKALAPTCPDCTTHLLAVNDAVQGRRAAARRALDGTGGGFVAARGVLSAAQGAARAHLAGHAVGVGVRV